MRRVLMCLALACAALSGGGCASIISKSDWPVTITSATPGTAFKITDENGLTRVSAVTPTTVVLPSGDGYFDGQTFTVESEFGTRTLNSKINGWYFGNLIFGGLLGLLIVDPITGAMWRLPETFDLMEPVRTTPKPSSAE